MKPQLKSLFSAQVTPTDLEDWSPDDPTMFGLWMQAFVGEAGTEGVDSFDIFVCTPTWLAQNWNSPKLKHPRLSSNILPGRSIWMMQTWDLEELENVIRELVDSISANDWGDFGNRLGRHLPWEFDYRYDEEQDNKRIGT